MLMGRSINRRDGDAAVRKARANDRDELISAAEVACYAYCPEQWRLEYGLELPPANRAALDAGTRHHAGKALAERIATVLGMVGIGMMVLAGLVLLWMLLR